ncbi:MAG: ATP-binding protein [Gammaproteobacteria bacterium]|nr:ATP-binding protein [Gammaproteobacteria bacterium]
MAMVSGPRQVGKTTLARAICGEQDTFYFNWDDFDDRELLLQGTKAIAHYIGLEQLRTHSPLLVLDEIHKFAKWKQLVKGFYDKYQGQCHILVTGSARMDVYKKGGDSLMGRYFHYRLHPLSVREVLADIGLNDATEIQVQQALSDEDFEALLIWGGFPEPFLKRERRFFNRWSKLREQQLLQEDVRELTKVQELGQLEVLAVLLKSQVGQLTSYSNLAKRIRVSVDTVRRWLSILAAMYYCYEIRPWTKNVTRSLLKEPKYYLWDWSQCTDVGMRNENFIASHLLKAVHYWTDTGSGDYGLYFLRDKEKREVDFLVSKDGKPWFMVEVKSSMDKPLSSSLDVFAKQLGMDHVFQVAIDGEFIDKNVFDIKRPVIVSAKTFLSQLV